MGLCWRVGSISIHMYTQISTYMCVHTRGGLVGVIEEEAQGP